MPTRIQATGIGLLAVVLWSAIVGLIRAVSEHFGPLGGAALIYSVAAAMLCRMPGRPPVRAMPRRYLLCGGVLFVAYELCLALSIGFAHTPRQAIEVSMLNYLWPTFTLLAAVACGLQKGHWLMLPGFTLSLLGVGVVLGGAAGLDWAQMRAHMQSNPPAYALALAGAVIWAAYCVVTRKMARGHNAIHLFFILVALALWLQYFLGSAQSIVQPGAWSLRAVVVLLLAACAMGWGYAAWNVGILHGHMTVLSAASYFIPVFSAALAAAVLGQALPAAFWRGALLVCLGSLLCWLAARRADAAESRGN